MAIYADHAATTPVDPAVREMIEPFLQETYGNPASPHLKGEEAHDAVERAREQVAELINAEPQEIIFTAGATESINTILKGYARGSGGVATTTIEHKATKRTCEYLAENDVPIAWVPVDKEGFITEEAFDDAVADAGLASVIWGNNEIGTIQDMKMIADHCADENAALHVDATQLVGKVPIDVKKSGIDALSASAHKFYGPKGAGFLYCSRNVQKQIDPLLHGGGQEYGLRSGTVNVPGVVGLGKAAECARERMEEERSHLRELAEAFIGTLEDIENVTLNGPREIEQRVPGHTHFTFEEESSAVLIAQLSERGICASTGSACLAGEPSHVLGAIGIPERLHDAVVRFTFGRGNTEKGIDRIADVLKELCS